jgi:SWI/SNF-related matrix-associated actin-dependent regulator of chromatin subfamily D
VFYGFPEQLIRHMFPDTPIVLDYTVKVHKEAHLHPVAFDVQVELESPLRDRIKTVAQGNGPIQKEIAVLDEQV